MAGRIEARLKELGITLPEPGAPVANYIPWTRSGNLLIVSGQLPWRNGAIHPVGKIGAAVTPEAAKEGAGAAFLSCLAHAKVAAGGDLDRIRQVLRLGGFINAAPGFTALPAVMNGASDLAVAIFGEAGRHARSTIGVAELPSGAAVEVEAMFELA
ncbi:MAG: RidA family protein [Acetobacteraceae bacterium]|nr:RidA family protein [Acetobacteraceae bacterium]